MAGPLDSLNTTVSAGISWNAVRVDPVAGNLGNQGSRGSSTQYSSVSGAQFPANQQKVYREVLAASATFTLNLFTPSANVCQNTAATFTSIHSFHIKLLSPTSAPGIVTAVCAGATVGPSTTNPLGLILKGTNPALSLLSDDEVLYKSAVGFIVDATHNSIDIINLDTVNQAVIELTFTGVG